MEEIGNDFAWAGDFASHVGFAIGGDDVEGDFGSTALVPSHIVLADREVRLKNSKFASSSYAQRFADREPVRLA